MGTQRGGVLVPYLVPQQRCDGFPAIGGVGGVLLGECSVAKLQAHQS